MTRSAPDPPDVEAVRPAVARHAWTTPLLPAADLGRRLGRPVWLKAECLQRTGSFKVRGAAARLEALDPDARRRGVVTCSSGNHGRALSFVARRLGIPATIFVPRWVDPLKLDAIRASGAETVLAGDTFDESEALAQERAESEGRTWVSAYDDPWVIAGQGTVGTEILDALDTAPSHVLVPLSGGGLAAGIAVATRRRLGTRAPRIVGVSATNAAVMLASLRAGRPVEVAERDTLASALAGGIGRDNRWSFGLVRDEVAEHVEVGEEPIARAMRYAVERHRIVVEGGGAVGLAALLDGSWTPSIEADGPADSDLPVASKGRVDSDRPIVVVLSGGNVALSTLVSVLERTAGEGDGSGAEVASERG